MLWSVLLGALHPWKSIPKSQNFRLMFNQRLSQRSKPAVLSRHLSSGLYDHSRKTYEILLHRFQDAVVAGQSSEIHATYHHMRGLLASQPQLFDMCTMPTDDILGKAMQIMALSSSKDEINVVFVMFADLTSLFSKLPQLKHHRAFIQAMLSRGWLDQARSRLRDYSSSIHEYYLVMLAYCDAGQGESALAVFLEAIQRGVHPDQLAYGTMIRCLVELRGNPILSDFKKSLHTYLSQPQGLTAFTHEFWSALLSHQRQSKTQRNEPRQYNDLSVTTIQGGPLLDEQKVQSLAVKPEPTSLDSNQPFHRHLQNVVEEKGFDAGMEALEKENKKGFLPTIYTIRSLAAKLTRLSDLRKVQKAVGIPVDSKSWSSLIENVLRAKGLSAALEVYETAREAGEKPTSIMVAPILRRFCEEPIRSANEQRFQQAMQIYNDLVRSAHESESAEPPSCQVYETLLRSFVDSSDPHSTFPLAVSLLKDMMRLNVAFERSTAATLLILLMRSSPSHDSAYELYALFEEQYSEAFDSEGRNAILGAFSKLAFSHQLFTPPSLFFLMLRDMQRKGFHMTKRAYTTMLAHIARVCKNTKSTPQLEDPLGAIRQIHKRLLLDSTLTPDTPLLNSLMNAYNYAGSPVEAMRVWETLYIQGKHNNGSVSIALDTLSYSGAVQQGAALIAKLHKSGFALDHNNWQSWLELLCRAGRIEEAVRLLCFDMPRSQPPVSPNKEQIITLLKYAWNVGKRGEVQSRIRRCWPIIWSGLPEEVKN